MGTLGMALALFLVLCGGLLLATGIREGGEVRTVRVEEAKKALDSVDRAERSFATANYGDARLHMKKTRKALADMIDPDDAGH